MRKSGRIGSAIGATILAFLLFDASAAEVGLVTAVSGNVKWQENKAPATELKPFVKIREGDQLIIESATRLQLVYFEGGRQETWQGTGTIEVGSGASKTIKGSFQPEVKHLPAILVKQLSKTPSPDGNVKAGMIRVRSITPPYDKLETVEKTYAEMRGQAEANDRSPELYLLASYFELREFDRLEAKLKQMGEKTTGDTELAALNTLYSRAIGEAKKK